MRIISLLPSTTEIVYALGLGDSLVGRSHECDFPEEVNKLPVLTSSKVMVELQSLKIERQVKLLLENALSIYKLNTDLLKELRPDIILTQDQCKVCAVSFDDVKQEVKNHLDFDPKIISVSPNNIDDVYNDILSIAEALDVQKKGSILVDGMKERMNKIADKTIAMPHPRVASIEWLDPIMAGGNWMPTLIEMAGGNNLFGEAGKHSPWMEWDALVEADPDMLLILPCGFGIERTKSEMNTLIEKPDWAKLMAVRKGRVYILDGNQYFNRPGPRLEDSLRILAEIIHPEAFASSFEDSAWIKL